MAEPIGPDTLAALLDGTLPPEERERVLRAVAADPALREQLGDAAAVLEELERPRGAVAAPRAPLWRVAGLGVAAIFAGALLLPVRRAAYEPQWLARLGLTAPADTSWMDPGWSATRGGVPTTDLEARAVRLGVRFTDLRVALNAGAALPLAVVRADLAALLTGEPGAAVLAAQLSRLDGGSGEAAWQDLGAQLAAASGAPDWFAFGLLLESARLAALTGQTTTLSWAAPNMLARLQRRWDGAPPLLDSVRIEVAQVNDSTLASLAHRLGEVIRTLAH